MNGVTVRNIVCGFLVLVSPVVLAQTAPPLSGRILESQKPVEAPKPPDPKPPVLQLPGITGDSVPAGGMTFLLQGVTFEGNSAIASSELQQLLQPMLGREVTLADLHAMANAISAHYAANGFVLVQAVLPPQTVNEGRVRFQIVEGFADRVRIARSSPVLDDHHALAYFDEVVGQRPLTREALEKPLLLINRLPVSAQASLEPGAEPGSSTVGVLLDAGSQQQGLFFTDNFGSEATGEARAGLDIEYAVLSGRGDQLRGSLLTSEGTGIESGGLGYSLPLGVQGLQLDMDIQHLAYTLGGPFASLDGHGEANDASVRVTYPLLLTPSAESEVWGAYHYRKLRDVLDAVGETNRRRIGRAELGISHSGFDNRGGWNYAMLSYSAGELTLDEPSAKAADVYGQEGFFSKANMLLTRQQRLTGSLGLNLLLQGQYAWQNLDSGEKFSLGGPYSVRAYPVSELSGDTGWLAQWSLQWYVTEQVTLSVFSDRGYVRFNAHELQGNPWAEQYLRSTGLGLDWQGPHGVEFHASWAWSGSYESVSDSGNTDGRFYGVLRKRF